MKRIEDVNILVIGDICIDDYIYTNVSRISPEAPIPIALFEKEEIKLGMAGNVVTSIASIGANVGFIGCCGNDDMGRLLNTKIKFYTSDNCYVYFRDDIPTIVKQRIIGNNQQSLLRVDKEEIKEFGLKFSNHEWENFWDFCFILGVKLNQFDVIIISDYGKGFITSDLIDFIHKLKKPEAKILVDPDPNYCWDKYYFLRTDDGFERKSIYLIKPNQKEWDNFWESSCPESEKDPYCEYCLLTKGSKGMTLYKTKTFEMDDEEKWEFPSQARHVYDVTGCGDVVISILAVCLDMGFVIEIATEIANKAAGISAEHQGTYNLNKEEFQNIIDSITQK